MHRFILLALPLALACSEQGFHGLEKADGGDGPAIEVTPLLLEYGTLGKDDEPVVQSFIVSSVGATDLTIDGITLDGAAAASFTVLTDLGSFILPPGAEEVIEVAFLPMGSSDQVAQAVIASDDSEAPNSFVDLVGTGAVPELSMSPDPLDFGRSYVGCEKDNEVLLTNVGTDLLVIENLQWRGDDGLWMYEGVEVPIRLEPGDSKTLFFGFLPDTDIVYAGGLEVTSNEPLGLRTLDVSGDAQYAGPYEDVWEIPSDPPSDIMFAVDQSCSMDDDQWRLANNFSTFISQLSGYSNDWQIIVANDDNGCTNSGLLRPTMDTSTYTALFSSAVQSGGGSYTESLLSVAANAVEQTGSGQCNAGFMRPDAMLHLILVSDEPEQSSYTNPGSSWSNLTQRMIDAKGSSGMVKVSAIAGPVPGGCGSADAGTGYNESVAATGGVFLSICSDWSTPENLALLAEASINQDTFTLTRSAVEETIEVRVNGNVRSAATWVYDAADNVVVFTEAVPAEGDEVIINYAGLATCD